MIIKVKIEKKNDKNKKKIRSERINSKMKIIQNCFTISRRKIESTILRRYRGILSSLNVNSLLYII
jgi:hypothetical protein